MVVSQIDHPRLDERDGARQHVLEPGAELGQCLGNAIRLPFFAVKLAADGALELVVAERFRLADEQRRHLRQLLAMFDGEHQRLNQILQMHEGLLRA